MPDNNIIDTIQKLSDTHAIQLLWQITKGEEAKIPDAENRDAVLELADSDAAVEPEDGEAARLALCLMAEDPEFANRIKALLTNPSAKQLIIEPITATLLSAGLLLALQTHVEFERKTNGKWSLKIVKKPTNGGLIAPLLKKLAALVK